MAKGATKHEVSLPELGLKDVLPNGSWLEQKQIQAALEARKHLVEVERIEKRYDYDCYHHKQPIIDTHCVVYLIQIQISLL